MSVVLHATWTVTPGREHIVREALASLAPATREEPGCLFFQPYVDPAEPNVIRIFEVYLDQDAVTAHAESAHFAQWALGVAIPELIDRRREFFETLDV
ncbi:MAG TPA: putative quinol monooxygenase [Pseudolysinimonas sp.]|nr:putative quinol monooxygenase [Pseudolysinimonas sp.]